MLTALGFLFCIANGESSNFSSVRFVDALVDGRPPPVGSLRSGSDDEPPLPALDPGQLVRAARQAGVPISDLIQHQRRGTKPMHKKAKKPRGKARPKPPAAPAGEL